MNAQSTKAAWAAALADYQQKRAVADATPLGSDNEDELVDAYCVAMDFLINLPAPDIAAVILKFELVRARFEGFEFPDNFGDAILADLRRFDGEANGDADLLALWDLRQSTLAEIERNGTYFDAEEHSPGLADIYDEAERKIVEATATTPRGVLAQAWVALSVGEEFTERDKAAHALIRRADFSALEPLELDWDYITALSVIRSLRRITGEDQTA